MAIEKQLNTRIQLKYDSLEKWNSNGAVVLKAGEIGICAIPSGSTAINGDSTRPQILFKVGDGSSPFSSLPWASAKAADVYEWAKQSTLPIVRASSETGDAGNVIASISWNPNTNKLEYTTASVATSEGIKEVADDLKALSDAVAAMYTNEQIDTKVADAKKAGTDAAAALESYKTSNNGKVQAVENAIAAINNAETGILATAKAYTDSKDGEMNTRVAALEAIKHEEFAKSADVVSNTTFEAFKTSNTGAINTAEQNAKNYADAIKKEILTGDSTEELDKAYDTLLEIQEWMAGDGVNVTELTAAIAAEATLRENADKALGERIDGEKTAREGAISGLDSRIDVLEAAVNNGVSNEAAKVSNALTVTLEDGSTVEFDGSAAKSVNLTGLATKVYADQAEADAITAANKYTDDEIVALETAYKGADTALSNRIKTVEDSYLNNVTVGDGLKVSNNPDIHGRKIEIDDAVTFVFNCGSSTVLVD